MAIELADIPIESYAFIGAFNVGPNICDKLTEQFKKHSKLIKYSDDMRQYHRLVNTDIDKSVDVEYKAILQECLQAYGQLYPSVYRNNLTWGISDPYNLQRYAPGKHYSEWHTESYGPEPKKFLRILTFITYLNDIQEGGETEFLYQKCRVRPQKGLTLIWPAGWTHIHKGLPAEKEVKDIVTGWCVYSDRLG